MTKFFKTVFTAFTTTKKTKSSDFSDFFTKTSGDKKRVIDEVLREANKEQRQLVEKYRKIPTGV